VAQYRNEKGPAADNRQGPVRKSDLMVGFQAQKKRLELALFPT